jgi:hypothetical protein
LTAGWCGDTHFVADVADLVSPAALHRHARIDDGERRQQPGTAIDADHLEGGADQAAAEQIGEKAFPFGGAFTGRQAKIDDLLLAVGPQTKGDQNRPPPVRLASTTPSSISTR